MKISDLTEHPITMDNNQVRDFQKSELLNILDNTWKIIDVFENLSITQNGKDFIVVDSDNNPTLYIVIDFVDNNTKYPFVSYIKKYTDMSLSGLIIHFYYKVLLSKYKTIYSDYQQTTSGLKVWKNLFLNLPSNVEMGIYDLRNNTYKQIHHVDELSHEDHTGKYQEFKIRFYIRYDT